MSGATLRYQCPKRAGLKFANRDSCELRRHKALQNPENIDLFNCQDCPGPEEIPPEEVNVQAMPRKNPAPAPARPAEPEPKPAPPAMDPAAPLCKRCGQAPAKIRKDGQSMGLCAACFSEKVARAMRKPRPKASQTQATTPPPARREALTELARQLRQANHEMGLAVAGKNHIELLVAASVVHALLRLAAKMGALPGWEKEAA